MMIRLYIFSLLLFAQFTFAAESLKDQHIQIDWLAPESFQANTDTYVGIRFRPDPDWHVYWKNPGDSGAAPKFQIQTTNAEVGPILWPYPTRLPVAHLTNLGYEGETAYLFKVRPNASGPMELAVDLEWLVCKEECIPGFGKMTLSRPVSSDLSRFKKSTEEKLQYYLQRLPTDGGSSAYRINLREISDETVKATITSEAEMPNALDLFPVDLEYILPAQPKISKTANTYEIIFQKSILEGGNNTFFTPCQCKYASKVRVTVIFPKNFEANVRISER